MDHSTSEKEKKIMAKGGRNVLTVLLAVLLLPLLCAVALADDFSGQTIETEWRYTQTNAEGLLPLYVFDQQQRMDDRGVKLLREVETDDWTIETYVAGDSFQSKAGLQAGLCAYVDGENYLFFGRDAAGKVVQCGAVGGREWIGSTVKADARYLRMVQKGQVYSFFYSEDGENWTEAKKQLTDTDGVLQNAQVGVMNRNTKSAELFHSGEMLLQCWTVEYGYFTLNGEMLPLCSADGYGWSYTKSSGVFVLAAQKEGMSMLLRQQKGEDWAIETRLGYTTGDDQTLTGLAMYQNMDNYLVLGIRGDLSNRVVCQVSGVLDGAPTGVLFTAKGMVNDMRGLRILRRTEEGQCDRYYFYTETNGNEYAYSCLGCYEDTAGIFRNGQYGLIGINEGHEQPFAAQFEYCTETQPDGYTDYFISKALDRQWATDGAEKLAVGNNRVTFASEEGKTAYLLRQNALEKDWQLDCTVLSLRNDCFAGLVLKGKTTLEFGQRDNTTLVMRVDGAEQAVSQQGANLRMVKAGNSYTMLSSNDGLQWTEVFCWEDEANAMEGARYGLAVQGSNCAFRWFGESYRPTGSIEAITGVELLFPLTGEKGINQTESRWGFGSGDLGSMFENNGKIYMVFGDTFSSERLQGGWIHNAIAIGQVDEPANGIQFSQMYIGQEGGGLVVPMREHTCAMIPSCGFAAGETENERLYMWVHEIYSWQTGGHRDISGAGWAVSDDGGESWEYSALFDGDSKFQFVSCWAEDDVLYLYGNYGGGYGETYLMQVSKEQVLDSSAYRYFAGTDEEGEPIWASTEAEAKPVLDHNEREIGITYNEYLDRYLLTGYDTFNDRMVIHESESLFGPWSDAYTLLPNIYAPVELESDKMPHIYGMYTLPSMVEDGGKSMYFTLSEYKPYQVYWVRVDFQKNNEK